MPFRDTLFTDNRKVRGGLCYNFFTTLISCSKTVGVNSWVFIVKVILSFIIAPMAKIMAPIDWNEAALDSEIEYSKAFGSKPMECSNFIHIYNPFVPWCGDFNRAVGVNVIDFQSFEEIKRQVESIHEKKGLERPNLYDLNPPEIDNDLWRDHLRQKGYGLSTAIYFCATTEEFTLPSSFSLTIPSLEDYLEWFYLQVQSRGYFEEEWFQKVKPLQLNFIEVFKPYWLMKGKDLVGWVYCANLRNYARLFEVEIQSQCQHQGMGKLLLRAIRAEGRKMGVEFMLLQSSEGLRNFYERAGFQECTRNSIIWLNG